MSPPRGVPEIAVRCLANDVLHDITGAIIEAALRMYRDLLGVMFRRLAIRRKRAASEQRTAAGGQASGERLAGRHPAPC